MWSETAIPILRVLINDLEENPKYSDDTLEQLLCVAGQYVNQEVNGFSYTFDFAELEISPDPETDQTFMNFMILKAACLTNTWEYNKRAIVEGLSAKLGPADIRVNSNGAVLLGLLTEGFCKTYDELCTQYNFGRSDIVKAILSPFTSNQYYMD